MSAHEERIHGAFLSPPPKKCHCDNCRNALGGYPRRSSLCRVYNYDPETKKFNTRPDAVLFRGAKCPGFVPVLPGEVRASSLSPESIGNIRDSLVKRLGDKVLFVDDRLAVYSPALEAAKNEFFNGKLYMDGKRRFVGARAAVIEAIDRHEEFSRWYNPDDFFIVEEKWENFALTWLTLESPDKTLVEEKRLVFERAFDKQFVVVEAKEEHVFIVARRVQ